MERAYRRYSKALFVTTLLIVLTVAGFNFIVNPMGLYPAPDIAGFNDTHPAGQNFSRLQKIEAIKRLKPDAIITGTSRADNGIDPRADNFPSGYKPYNAGLSAATIREQQAMLEFAHRVHPLKLAVITLDFFAFNGRKLDNKQFEPHRLSADALSPVNSFFDTYGTIVSLDTLVNSIKHLRYIRKPERYAFTKENGHKEARDVSYAIGQSGAASRFIKDPAAAETAVDNFSFNYSDKTGDDTLTRFEEMLAFARRENIQVYLLISPIHVSGLRRDAANNTRIETWKRHLVEINTRVAARYDAVPYPLWDFAHENSLTREAVPAVDDRTTQMKWFWDGGHYKAALGDVVLRKVLAGSTEYPDFGQRLDK